MVLRMLRVALPAPPESGRRARRGRPRADPAAGRGRLPRLPARGHGAPNAHPVARFLLFERAYPDSVAACVDSLHEVFTSADAGPRNSKPVLRVSRLAADLDFQRRALPDGAELTGICEQTQQELARIDQDVAERYFAGAATAGTEKVSERVHFAIRFLTEYRYDAPVTDNLNALRVRPATTSTQRCDEFHTRIEPEARSQPPPRLLRHRGDRVRHPHQPRAAHDRRARARRHLPRPRPPGRLAGRTCAAPPTWTPPASSRCRGRTSRRSPASRACTRRSRRQPAGDARAAVRADPRPLRIPAGRHLRGLERARTCCDGRRRVPGLRAPVAACCCAVAASPRATSPATCGRRPRTTAPTRVEVDTHAWLEALLPGDGRARRARVGERRPDQPPSRRRDAREDRPRALLLRRAARSRAFTWAAPTRS